MRRPGRSMTTSPAPAQGSRVKPDANVYTLGIPRPWHIRQGDTLSRGDAYTELSGPALVAFTNKPVSATGITSVLSRFRALRGRRTGAGT